MDFVGRVVVVPLVGRILGSRFPPTVMTDAVTTAGIDLVSRFWIANPDRETYLEIRSAYFQAVTERLQREGLELSPDLLELTGRIDADSKSATGRIESED